MRRIRIITRLRNAPMTRGLDNIEKLCWRNPAVSNFLKKRIVRPARRRLGANRSQRPINHDAATHPCLSSVWSRVFWGIPRLSPAPLPRLPASPPNDSIVERIRGDLGPRGNLRHYRRVNLGSRPHIHQVDNFSCRNPRQGPKTPKGQGRPSTKAAWRPSFKEASEARLQASLKPSQSC